MISSAVSTCLTALSWRGVNDAVICAIISVGEGELVPSVVSAHIREFEPSNWLWRVRIDIGSPIPYYIEVNVKGPAGSNSGTYVVRLVKEYLSYG